MTREEAVDILRSYLMFDKSNMQIDIALNMAIEALHQKGAYEQTKWERDVALKTLEEHGIGLGQKAEDKEEPEIRYTETEIIYVGRNYKL